MQARVGLIIRKVTLADLEELQRLSRETFYDTYKDLNTKENMRRHLSDHYSLKRLKTEIQSPDSEFYLALLENKIVGYIKINFGDAQTEKMGENAMELERIYVRKDFQNQHLGRVLLEKAVAIARKKVLDFVWLGVFTLNPRAIAFYEKNGFVKFGTHVYTVGDDDQKDFLMKINLS